MAGAFVAAAAFGMLSGSSITAASAAKSHSFHFFMIHTLLYM